MHILNSLVQGIANLNKKLNKILFFKVHVKLLKFLINY